MDQGAKSVNRVEDAMEDAAKEARNFDDNVDRIGEAMDGSTGKMRGGKDVLDGFSDSMEAMGVSIPGPVGNIAMLAGGVADMADGLLATAVPALKSLWAVMAANPLIAVAALVALLVAGFVIAYKKSETFRDIVNGAMGAVRDGIGWLWDKAKWVFDKLAFVFTNFTAIGILISNFDKIREAFSFVVDKVSGAATRLKNALSGAFDGVKSAARGAFNFVADAWNNTAGRLSFSVPGWVPGIGGKGFSVPQIPHFANGGVLDGLSVVGERGPELFAPKQGGRILSNADTMRAISNVGAQQPVVVRFEGDRAIVEMLRRLARVEGGGNVQLAFGR
jgi:phage-related protein